MNCAEVRERLSECVARGLGPDEDRAVAAHLETCPACRGELVKERTLQGGLKRMFSHHPEGKKPVPFTLPPVPDPVPRRSWPPFSLWVPAFALAALVAFLFFRPVVDQRRIGSPGTQPVRSVGGTAVARLESGSLLDLVARSSEQSGGRLLVDLPYEALERSSVRHLERMSFTIPIGTRFRVAAAGLSLDQGAGRFQVRPGSERLFLKTPTAMIGILGTEFDVLVDPALTLVHLQKGRLQVEGKNELHPMGPGEVMAIGSGTVPRPIHLDEGLWEIFQKHPKDWRKAVEKALAPPRVPPPPPASVATLPGLADVGSSLEAGASATGVQEMEESTTSGATRVDANDPEEVMDGNP